ncbi:myosin-2 essential light chain-like [Montipora capricornis]|uniref:myosin-2 essential light chain-like n=1 Tax=Montipora foliosa TaxID=591990 RepID=UPI0035F19F0A
MASTLTDREMDELRDNFGLYDTVGDGKVESSSMGQMLRSVGLNPTQAEVEKVMREIDPQGNKRISFEEFVPVVLSLRSRTHKYGQDVFVDSLRVFDSDGSGTINSGELRHVLTSLGEKLKDEDVDTLIQGFEDNSGLINYEDFVKSVMNG